MADESMALMPVEERVVEFYGDEIKGVCVIHTPSNRPVYYVPLRQLCDYLGVNYSGQRQRIERDPVLSKKIRDVQVSTAGGPQAMPSLPLDYLNGWLFGINANRVKEEIRDRVIRYQEECYQVLADAFVRSPAGDALDQVEALGQALITLAREQRQFNARLTVTEDDIAGVKDEVSDIARRMVVLEDKVAPGEPVTEEQAAQISQAVRAIAYKIAERTGRNEYGGVYSELYRKFGITSYKLLPADRYQEAMAFLQEWWQQIAGTGDVPF